MLHHPESHLLAWLQLGIDTTWTHYITVLFTFLINVPFLSQAASKVGESSDDFSQGATAAVPHSVETTVISELVVTSTLLLPGYAGPVTLPDGLLANTSI